MLSYSWIPKPSGRGSFQNILPPSNHQLIFQNSYLSRPRLVKPFLPPQRGRTTPLFCFHHHTLHSTLLFQHLLYRGVTTLGDFFLTTFPLLTEAGGQVPALTPAQALALSLVSTRNIFTKERLAGHRVSCHSLHVHCTRGSHHTLHFWNLPPTLYSGKIKSPRNSMLFVPQSWTYSS